MEPTTPSREYPLGEYTLKCQTCQLEHKWDYPMGARWRVGYVVTYDETQPVIGRCPRCRSYSMEVIRVPEEATPTSLPTGLHLIPGR